jgi:hypothetical protein
VDFLRGDEYAGTDRISALLRHGTPFANFARTIEELPDSGRKPASRGADRPVFVQLVHKVRARRVAKTLR